VTDPSYVANWHHELIGEKLEEVLSKVERKEKARLIIEVPPRHGKSALATTKFPAWALGKYPSLKFIITSYAADLAEKFGQATKDIMLSSEYGVIFPETSLRKDTKAKGDWATTKNGSYTAVGVGGPITGKGAHIAIIDDPVKNREEAESQTIRDKVWDWYTSTLYTRLEGDGAIIVIMTRWHQDDLVGRLLEQQAEAEKDGRPHDKWEVIRLPAIAEEDEPMRKEGDALWPDKFPLPTLSSIRENVGVYDWASLYQQDPVSAAAQVFKKEHFQYYTPEQLESKYLTYHTFIDPAISQKEKADNTVVLTIAKEANGPNIYRIREDAGHFTPTQTLDLVFAHHAEFRSQINLETIAYQAALKYAILEEQKRRQTYFTVNEIRSKTNKELRIRGLIPLYDAGVIWHKRGDVEYERELLTFPSGRRDDRIDTMSMFLLVENRAGGGIGQFRKNKVQSYLGRGRR